MNAPAWWRRIGVVAASFFMAAMLGCDLDGDEFGESGTSSGVAAAAEPPFPTDNASPAGGPPPLDQGEPKADGKRTNRLSRESSPYLLLHAHNPVDWYPWGPEAFEAAKKENKPIFLSIGYSSCYWCHVMERLVFTDEKIAAVMNEKFINIKVDREERPDIDDIYMTSLLVYYQLLGSPQGGGWPLSLFLTPEGKPFAGGSYFPPRDENGRLGFATVANRVATLWKDKPDDIKNNAELLTKETQRVMKPALTLQPVTVDRELALVGVKALVDSYDPRHGGVDFDPNDADSARFPVPAKLALLQYEIRRHGDRDAEKIIRHTLDELHAGGIHDHLAGGFHRYSTDREWHVPHFEKMLYDQAQLADVYVESFRLDNRTQDRIAADDVLGFVLREMTTDDGAFQSAIDAETDGIEGKYYVWSKADVERILGAEDAPLFVKTYGLDGPQTFEHGYVLRRMISPKDLAESEKADSLVLERRLEAMRTKLLEARETRKKPLEDDKVITSWNGLMIRGARARAGSVLGRDEYLRAAEKAAMFVLTKMRDGKGRLYRTHRGGEAKLNAYLDDYAFLVDGLLALHDATRDERWLNAARHLTDDQIELFWDEQGHGFYFTPHHHEALIARTKNAHDSVLPAGNSIAIRNLVRLAILTGDESYRRHARETIDLFAPQIKRAPRSTTALALAISEYLDAPDDPNGGAALPPRDSEPDPFEGAVVQVGGEEPIPPRVAAATDDPKPGQKSAIVKARAYLSVDKLPPGRRCRIVVFVDVEPGWHINANPAQPDYLIPTAFSVKSTLGVQAVDMVYPAGKAMTIKDIDEPVLVYENRIVIRGLLDVPTDAAGRIDDLELQVRYQPCNDARCLKPTVATLKGSVPIARTLAEVKSINENLFRQD